MNSEVKIYKNIEKIGFVFENVDYRVVPFNKFEFFRYEKDEIHFKIANCFDVDIDRFWKYEDIVKMNLITGNEVEEIKVPWCDYEYDENDYQIIINKELRTGTVEIKISKKEYLIRHINNSHKSIEWHTERLIFLNEELDNIK